jgi:glycosyltransferase involved in cell wall biosynthesis
MTPKIAIVHDWLQSLGGAERVTLALSEIYPEAPIYTLTYNPKLDDYFGNKRIITSYLQRWTHFQRWARIPSKFLLTFYPLAIESFDFSDFDIVISSSHSFAKNIITPADTTHISYIHSPMRYVWDTWHTYLAGKRVSGLAGMIIKNILSQIRIWDFLGAGRVDVFVANSHNVKNRIKKYYRHDAQVIYPPVDVDKIALGTPGDYFLVISRLSDYKRVDLAVQVCNELNLPLKVIGTGEAESRLRQLAGPTVEILGWQSDAVKIHHLQNCRALLFPGEEDFGIVPVEAMAAGKPVIAYRKGGLIETVMEGQTGLFFDEPTVVGLKGALQQFLARTESWDSVAIRRHAETFSKAVFQSAIKTLVNRYVHGSQSH